MATGALFLPSARLLHGWPVLLMAMLFTGCSDPAKPQLAAAAAIHALDERGRSALHETPECRASGTAWGAASTHPAPALLRTSKGTIALLTSTEAAGLSGKQAQELAAVILLTRGGEPPPPWPHQTPLIRHGDLAKPPGSALQTLRLAALRQSTASWAGWLFTLLMNVPAGGDIQLQAVVARHPGLDPVDRSIVWFPAPSAGSRENSQLNLLTSELLYSHVFSQDPEAGMRLDVATRGQAATVNGGAFIPQATLLRRLALARQCAAAVVAGTGAASPVPWQVAMLDAVGHGNGAGQVQARLRGGAGPLPGQQLIFTRQPHFECSGQTGADGVVACELKDLMGHNGHPGFERAPVIVSFPGKVDAERILLPTTSLWRR